MRNSSDLARRVTKAEQQHQQIVASNEDSSGAGGNGGNYGPAMVIRLDSMLLDGLDSQSSSAARQQDERRVAHAVSRVTAEAQAAHYTQPWRLYVRTTEDGGLELAGPPWWDETPAPAAIGRFDAHAALAALAGIGFRRYS